MIENWKRVKGYEDYLISDCGRIKTLGRKIRYVHAKTGKELFRQTTEKHLKIYTGGQGYYFVQLYKNGISKNKTIHRLVAENFIDNPDFLPVVNHKDGNKINNTVGNLEWCTDSYNHQQAMQAGLTASGSRVASAVLNEVCVIAIKKLLSRGWTHSKVADLFNVSKTTITLINTGKTWKNALIGQELTLS